MSTQKPGFELLDENQDQSCLLLTGDWIQGQAPVDFAALQSELRLSHPNRLTADAEQ